MSSASVKTITIHSETIELSQLLKFEGLVSSGGEAKQAINDGLVKVNGETESRKRRKLVHGDSIEFNGESYQVLGSTA
ncbi:MAG TPA: RNA-binding protein [Opitutae bacterium]|nr:RNA-binding protein [Opitutaceae bacterium]HCR31685.1 RNA-binding protein [Opitutae bacterium]|tara:strand:+ start:1559 stop:1792 length:234 start_codon:yes stop_codon:yes gene_type:complete